MPALIMDMRAIAATLRQHIRQDVVAFNREYNQTPCLVMLGFCDDQATIDLMGIMGHHSGEIGIRYWAQIFPTNIKESELRYHIERYNNDPSVHAISLQLPLPKQLNLEKISSYISVEKDVEGLHPTLLGRSLLGQSSLISPAALSITRLLSLYNIDPSGRHVVIVERNPESGSSLAGLLSQQSAIITLCPITTTNLRLHTRQAEILVTNVGQPDFIKADMVRPGAVVLDCGINYLNKS
ncbi:MAG: bifunctional 5,10-methylenetetrahydrofolate dehydrogenase/5,10-methenyltetrahydrofolate cyclohydrolase, partial [Chloroflexota bacterium]